MKKLLYLCVALSFVFVFGATCYAVSYETEPNNDKAQADALTSGVPIVGQISDMSTDDDWFYICTSGADLIQTSFDTPDQERYTGWHIYIEDAHGNVLSQVEHHKTVGEPTEISTAVSEAGIYYVKIRGTFDDSYSLTASISNPGDCPNEPSQYDLVGIWQVVGRAYYFSFYISGSTAVVITFIPGAGEGYMMGDITGNTGHITYASDVTQFNATFTATSDTTGTLAVNTCVPFSGEHCLLPAGETVNVKRIF
jgi:hypothetical protein